MEAVKCDNFCKEFWTSKKSIRPSVLPSFSYILKPHCIKLHTIHSKIKINFEICIKLISNNITIFYPQIYFAISKQFCFLHGLIRSTRLLISEKSATYTIKWSYTIIWQVRVSHFNTCKTGYTCNFLKKSNIIFLDKYFVFPFWHSIDMYNVHSMSWWELMSKLSTY